MNKSEIEIERLPIENTARSEILPLTSPQSQDVPVEHLSVAQDRAELSSPSVLPLPSSVRPESTLGSLPGIGHSNDDSNAAIPDIELLPTEKASTSSRYSSSALESTPYVESLPQILNEDRPSSSPINSSVNSNSDSRMNVPGMSNRIETPEIPAPFLRYDTEWHSRYGM